MTDGSLNIVVGVIGKTGHCRDTYLISVELVPAPFAQFTGQTQTGYDEGA